MDLDALKALFEEFDLAAFLPDLTGITGWIETVLRVAAMAGPILLLGFGLLYLMAPPKVSLFSASTTLWPRSASEMAACMPAGPPPMTKTFLGVLAGRTSLAVYSLPEMGLTLQRTKREEYLT